MLVEGSSQTLLLNTGELLTLLHSQRPKLYTILASLSAKGLIMVTTLVYKVLKTWPCIMMPFKSTNGAVGVGTSGEVAR